MGRVATFSLIAVLLAWVASTVMAFSVDQLSQEFDARLLTEDEKRFLQAGLAFANVYSGMIDGAWGPASQKALERYEAKSSGDAFITNGEVVLLALDAYAVFDKGGWARQRNGALDMSYLVPMGLLRAGTPSDHFVNLTVDGTTFGYSLTVGTAAQAARLHDYTMSEAVGAPYTVRKSDLWITSARTTTGISLYTRSDFRGRTWSTILLGASEADAGMLAAVSGSIKPGWAPNIGITPGRLSAGVVTLAALMDDQDQAEAASSALPEPQPERNNAKAFGTGFLVSTDGQYLTNNHVVDGCRTLSVAGVPAVIVAQDASFDLALVRVDRVPVTAPAQFAEKPARLNSDVTVAGFPLPDILGGLNVTRGSVTSLKGLGGDGINMQISAPVQPGNSGGPVINGSGHVVGVVVAKLDAQYVADRTGDIPQNVNFAIRAEIAKLFLYQNGVEPIEAADEIAVAPEALADLAQGFTSLITCN